MPGAPPLPANPLCPGGRLVSTGAGTAPCTFRPARVPGAVLGLVTALGGGGGASRSRSPTPARGVPLVALSMTPAACSRH